MEKSPPTPAWGGTDGTGTDVIGSAVGAAGLSFVTFASGAAAAVVTYGLGRVFGTTIG